LTLALDTDVLVGWAMTGAPHHRQVRILVEGELAARRGRVGLVPRVVEEFLHVATDKKRFPEPFTMPHALAYVEALLSANDIVVIEAGRTTLPRTLELLRTHKLGRKRILDTALAATLEAAGIRRLATFNGTDFASFDFLDVVDPRSL
jgi:predicted nucleic acid-binding protein